jgi:hypothetical protein
VRKLLIVLTHDPRDRAMAEAAMRYLVSPTITGDELFLPGILLADRELAATGN